MEREHKIRLIMWIAFGILYFIFFILTCNLIDKMFKVPNQYRLKNHPMLASDESYGNNGAFAIPIEHKVTAFVIASDGDGWEHVSAHIMDHGKDETPSWEEMCKIKDLFWDEEDCIVQFHPPKTEYVNHHEHCLHLWREEGVNWKTPARDLIG